LVTVESSDFNEEYVLLIGGIDSDDVYKFNGTWFPFGKLNKPRFSHSLIHWNGAVYVIGGFGNTKLEIWNIKDSPDRFKSKENWPELFEWTWPHLFIVPDTFFPDH